MKPVASRLTICFFLLLFIGITLFPFLSNLHDPFVSDDWVFLANFDASTSVREVLTQNTFGEQAGGTYRPMVNIFWLGMQQLFAVSPLPYHMATLVFHVINGILFFFLLRRLLLRHASLSSRGTTTLAYIVALLFSLLQTQGTAVLWISVINDTMMTTFYVLALHAYISFLTKKQGYLKYLLFTCFALFLSISTKEMALTFPIVASLIGLSFFQQIRTVAWRRFLFGGIATSLTVLTFFLLRYHIIGSGVEQYTGSSVFFSLTDCLRFVWGAMIQYFSGASLRAVLISFVFDHVWLLSALIVLFGTALTIFLWQKSVYRSLWQRAVYCFAAFVCSVIPVVSFGTQRSMMYFSHEGDRFLYLPSIFFLLVVAFCLAMILVLIKRNASRLVQQCLALIGLLLFVSVALFSQRGLAVQSAQWTSAAQFSDQLAQSTAVFIEEEALDGAVFLGLPDSYHGAFIFRNGFPEVVNQHLSAPMKDILALRMRTLINGEQTFELTQESASRFVYAEKNDQLLITDIPERKYGDYSSELFDAVHDTTSLGYSHLGAGFALEFSADFMETNREKKIGLFYFDGEGWKMLLL